MFRNIALSAFATFALAASQGAAYGQASNPHARTMLIDSIDESKLVTLRGNTRPEATVANDRGKVAGDRRLEHIYLQLKRSPDGETAVKQFVDQLYNPASVNFHHWLTAAQFGQRFGLAQQDLDTVTGWLVSQGFAVNHIYPNLVIDISGTVAQVNHAFHTEMHHLSVRGEAHIANMSDPKIPAALSSVVAGVVSLNSFKPHRMSHPVGSYTVGANTQLVTPADLQTIYNFAPAYKAGFTGTGQTIVVLEDSDVYSTGDWHVFRKTFKLSRAYPHGSFVQVHPGPDATGTAGACDAPGVNSDDGEAIVDAEWASAAAPDAAIVLASCADTDVNFGAFIAMENMLTNGDPVPGLMSLSYAGAEAQNGQDGNLYVYYLYELAAAEGVSVFAATGDWGAAASDEGLDNATHGIGASGLASTPFNVAVGGTDFGDHYNGVTSRYWSPTNTITYGSALSYVPEIPWNDSCAGALLSGYEGFATPYGATGFCNSSSGKNFIDTAAGSGGPSGCALGAPSVDQVVSGTCQGWPKPDWQSVAGNPDDGVRDTPDVSLFAANGLWGHYYVLCYSDTTNGGKSCFGAPSTWTGIGGTSVATPVMAAIQALVNQATGSLWGNPNPIYYQLASSQYGANGNAACDATLGNASDPSCIFHDVTQGDIAVNCTGDYNCFVPSGKYGILATSNTGQPAYPATVGWDFASGIGSVNVSNLIANWPSATPSASVSLSASQ